MLLWPCDAAIAFRTYYTEYLGRYGYEYIGNMHMYGFTGRTVIYYWNKCTHLLWSSPQPCAAQGGMCKPKMSV